jgi:hypothetical protein
MKQLNKCWPTLTNPLSLTLIWPQWMWMLDKLLSRTLKGIANTR